MPTTVPFGRAVLAPALVVLAAACALLTTAVTLAGPAAAIEDPRRPSAEITHGPSCGPGVVRVTVTNGTAAHHVALVFDGADEQDAADLAAGEKAELTSADIDWGHTVDVSVAITRSDGTAEDPIRFGTYTRPSAEDCAAVSSSQLSPEGSAAPATTSDGTTTTPPPTGTPSTRPTTPSDTLDDTADGSSSPAPAPGVPPSVPPAPPADGGTAAETTEAQAGGAPAASVSPGGVLTVRATGFTAGEPVTVTLVGVDDPLTTVTAAADGSVEAVVQIPRAAALGTATVQLVGRLSDAIAGLDLQVAARTTPVAEQATSVPVLAAGSALIAVAAVLGLVAARRGRGPHIRTPR